MKVAILTPDREVFSGEVTSVTVPGVNGSFQVLDNHSAIVSSLVQGTVKVEEAGTTHVYTIEKGFIEVLNNNVALLVQGLQDA